MSAEKRIGSRRPDRRDEVLRAALRVIEREGLQGASMRAIASEIGCTTGVLTHFFRSKQELIDAATDTVFGPFDAGLAAEFEGEDARRRLRRVLVNVLPVNAANRGVIRLWMELARGAWSSRTFAAGYRERYAASASNRRRSVRGAGLGRLSLRRRSRHRVRHAQRPFRRPRRGSARRAGEIPARPSGATDRSTDRDALPADGVRSARSSRENEEDSVTGGCDRLNHKLTRKLGWYPS